MRRDLTDYDVGAYPGLILTVHLERHLTYYMLQHEWSVLQALTFQVVHQVM